MRKFKVVIVLLLLVNVQVIAQNNPVVDAIVKEANDNSQLEPLAHELMDVIGPRLVGTPQMKQAQFSGAGDSFRKLYISLTCSFVTSGFLQGHVTTRNPFIAKYTAVLSGRS